MTQVGSVALFSKITSSPLDACSWLLIVPFTGFTPTVSHTCLLCRLRQLHKNWAGTTSLLFQVSTDIVCDMESRSLWSWHSKNSWFGKTWDSQSGVHKYLPTLWNSLPASALENVWFHTAVFQSSPLLHLFSLHQQKRVTAGWSSAALLAEQSFLYCFESLWKVCLPGFNQYCRGWLAVLCWRVVKHRRWEDQGGISTWGSGGKIWDACVKRFDWPYMNQNETGCTVCLQTARALQNKTIWQHKSVQTEFTIFRPQPLDNHRVEVNGNYKRQWWIHQL